VALSTVTPTANTVDRQNRSYQLAMLATRTAADNNGKDIVVLDMREQTSIFDYFVIATGTSRRQLHAISDEIESVLLRELGDRRIGLEGYQESHWVILDYGDVVIHLFDENARKYYDLEGLWGAAQRVDTSNLTRST
jgi:ribosome-associated protein